MPRLTSLRPKVACVAAILMSVARSKVMPPPRQKPFTAAMMGFQTSSPTVEKLPTLCEHQLGELGRVSYKALKICSNRESSIAGAGDQRHSDLRIVPHRRP